MLTDEFARVPCSSIVVDRASRQRRVIDTSDIDFSIRTRGVIHPIVVDREMKLIAGERRLASSIKVGLPTIPIRYVDQLDEIERQMIELEENIKRSALTWQDEAASYGRLHQLYMDSRPDWTSYKTAEDIGVAPGTVSRYTRLYAERNNPKIANCANASEAYNVIMRSDERRVDSVMATILEAGTSAFPHHTPIAPIESIPMTQPTLQLGPQPKGIIPAQQAKPTLFPESIFLLDFLPWVEQYTGPKFNFIHCDFPYGKNVFAAEQSGKNRQTTYNDDPDVYWKLIESFCKNRDRFISHSAHLMFWFSMDWYHETLELFRKLAPELEFQPHPLYWTKSDNVGILPDAQRGPRRIVETCFIASREDRKIVRAKSNAYSCPTDKTFHTSTKPEPMLRFFLEMFIDEQSTVLDPTCGSGAVLRAAESLGARRVIGLERDKEHYDNAVLAMKQFRLKRMASQKLVEA